METPLPDYYRTLGVSPSSNTNQIREAYKRASLETHPDRFPNATAQERQRYTQRFQTLADAYYVLSDSERRREYDELRASRPASSFFTSSSSSDAEDDSSEKEQGYSANFFQNFFPGSFKSHTETETDTKRNPNFNDRSRTSANQPRADGVFADVFEELLRPEVHRVAPWWKWVGTISGGALGFIVGNVPGALGGAFAGSQLGRIRDAKGKSVAEVFINLGAGQRAEVLTRLLQKLLAQQASRG